MKKHRLIPIFLVLCLCFAAVAGLCACPSQDTPEPTPEPTPAPATYTVTYDPQNGGSTFGAVVTAGGLATEPAALEREGYTFRFWSADGTTAFDFTAPVTADLRLTAVWAEAEAPAPETVRIRWEGDEVADFVFEGTTPRTAAVGDVISFRVRVSPYYTGTPVVSAGSVTAARAENGTYSFTVTEAVTVRISGLRRDTTPIRGMGTERSPYLIETASQLKTVTDSINAGEDKYRAAYLRLMTDLDMGGVALDPIGSSAHYFEGTFDGAGHTVRNFRFREGYGAVGFFGYIAQGVVKDLHLSADLSILCADASYNYIIGPVVAYCISGDVINCSFDGSLAVQFDVSGDNVAYVGGIVGFLQGYGTDYIGTVSFSYVNADITSVGQVAVTGMGGIVGAAYGTSDQAPACIYNSAFTGRILGRSERSGGIVGYLRTRASVANCLSEGILVARYTDGVAACGAIVGAADNETALTACASTASLNAVGADAGDADVGDLVGIRYARGYNGIDTRATVLLDCHYSKGGHVTRGGDGRIYLTLSTSERADLGWRPAEWNDEGGALLPDITGYEGDAFEEFSVRFVFGRNITMPGPDGTPLTQTEDTVRYFGYGPLYWVYGGSGMNNFKADDGQISYGYFADEACTVRLPACTILTGGTVYVGFADYSAMVGEYYAVIGDREIRLTFDDNGKMTMYTNGILANYVYVYNGEKLLLREAYFACFAYPELMRTYDLEVDYYAVPTTDGLRIYDNVFFTEERGDTLSAVKKTDAMGDWYTVSGAGWTFRADGTGTSPAGGFTYTLFGRALTIAQGAARYYLTLSEDGQTMESADRSLSLSRRDAYFGDWESAFNLMRTLSVNGAGTLTLDGVDYAYTLDENGNLTFSAGQAYFDQNGLLILVQDGRRTTFGRRGSYIGYWKETYVGYDMELDGIGREGYGIGRDSNGVTFTYVAPDTGEDGFEVNLYYRTQLYGMFSLTKSKLDDSELLDMAAYTASSGMLVNDYFMCYLDPMNGTWHTPDGTTYTFNGLGTYNIDYHAKDMDWVAIGEVKATKDGVTTTVRYTYNRKTGKATFPYGGKTVVAAVRGGELYIDDASAAAPDGLEDYILCTADGSTRYTFNGKSGAGLGVLTILDRATGQTTEYAYTMTTDEDGAYLVTVTGSTDIRISDTRIVTLDADGSESGELQLFHTLCGRTYLAAGGSTVTLPAYLRANGTADGHFGDTTVTYLYIDPTYLAIYYEGSFLYYVGYYTENTAVLLDGNFTVVSMLAVDDGFAGTYTAADGSVLTLDGRSAASDYIFAMATLTRTEDGSTVEETMVYLVEDGVYYLCELDRSGDEDLPVKRYRLSETAEDGAAAFTSEDGRTVYLTAVTE